MSAGTWRRLRAGTLLFLLCNGCVERALGEPEGGVADLAHAAVDMASSSDLASCGNAHIYTSVSLDSVVTLDGQDTFSPTAALRLLVAFSVRAGCDIPADLVVETIPGNATTAINVTARVWRGTSGCGPALPAVREVTVAAVHNQVVVVRDGTLPTSEPLLFLMASGTFSPSCSMSGAGDSCDDDCDCNGSDADTLCLVRADGTRRCGRACHEDTQCRANGDASACVPGDWMCAEAQICRSGDVCPFSQTVIDCRCAPPLMIGPSPPQCGCDADCPAGTLCGEGRCVQVCTGRHTCGSYGEGEGGTACFSGACEQLI